MANKAMHDRDVAATALEKLRRGEPISRREREALKRVKQQQAAQLLDDALRTFPRKQYYEITGTHHRKLKTLTETYGVPLNSREIDLVAVLRWLHKTLDERGSLLLDVNGDDPILAGGNSPALEKCRHEKWLLLQIERRQKERELIPVRMLAECHGQVANVLKTCGETLERIYGTDAGDILREALDAAQMRVDQLLANYENSQEAIDGQSAEDADGSRGGSAQPETNG